MAKKIMTKKALENIERLHEEYIASLEAMDPPLAEFFLLHIVQCVKRNKAWEMTHDIPPGKGKNPYLNRQRYIKKEACVAVHLKSFQVTLRKYRTYQSAKCENETAEVLDTAFAIMRARMSNTTYDSPINGKPVTRSPSQLGRNESIAAVELTSDRGRIKYKFESKVAAMNVIKDIMGMAAPKEVNVETAGPGVFGEIRIGFDSYEEPAGYDDSEELED